MAKAPEPPDPKIVRANVNREVIKGEHFASLYANDTQIQVSAWDVRLIFGLIDQVATQERPSTSIRLVGEVHISLHHAKKIAELLNAQIARFEKRTGVPIPLPD